MSVSNGREIDGIAIVGVGLRLAGGIDGPDEFWNCLVDRKSMVSDLPEGRWAAYPVSGPAASAAVCGAVTRAAYLHDAAGFDAEFFGITPREAVLVDPQQRLVLEVVWEALEQAGIPPTSLAGSDTGVIIGVGGGDYGQLLLHTPERIGPWSSIGGSYCAVANRVSYFLDLRGPSFAVDSACSSALAALHLGAQALRSGESDVVITGGVNLIAAPSQTLSLGAAGALAADGTSKPFSAAANGYGRGEGVAVVVLKRIADARRDGDDVLAVIRATTVRQDGRTNGIMAPNGRAQVEMLQHVYRKAGISPATVEYLEAHGTGTPLGDPIEAAATAAVFGTGRPEGEPLLIGSVKGNVGHLEAGAGAVGVVKTVLAMRNELIPPTIGPQTGVNPEVLAQQALRVVSEPTPWKRRPGHPRLAAVSSFGYGGTIGHIVLEEGDCPRTGPTPNAEQRPRVLVLSAASPEATRDAAEKLATALESGGAGLDAVAGTLAVRRSHLTWRTAVVAEDRAQAVSRLREWSATGQASGVVHARAGEDGTKPAFVFSGHGSQWVGMGRELLSRSPEFAASCAELDPIFREEGKFSLIAALERDDFTRTDRIQATLLGVQLGLVRAWEAHGVRPAAVVGHSMGEIPAAAVAGLWNAQNAARFACRRAALLTAVAGQGAMVLLDVPFEDLRGRLERVPGVEAGIEPAPGWSVASGDTARVDAFAEECASEGHVVRRIASDVAFHSTHMVALLDDLGRAAADLDTGPVRLPLYSTTTSDPRSTVPRDPAYWQQNLRNPVRFATAVGAMIEDGHRHFLEVSPHPVVKQNIIQIAEEMGVRGVSVAHSLRRGQPQLAELAEQLGELHCAGAFVDWRALWPRPAVTELPGPAWQHHPFWLPAADAGGGHDAGSHMLLGSRLAVATTPTAAVWQTRLTPDNRPYDRPHTVHGVDIVPASVLLGTLIAALSPDPGQPHRLRDVALHTPLPAEQDRMVQIISQAGTVTICSRPHDAHADAGWIAHTRAHDGGPGTLRPTDITIGSLADPALPASLEHVLDLLRPLGVSGLAFEWQVDHLAHNARTVTATVSAPDRAASWMIIVDAATTLASLPVARQGIHRMPASIELVEVSGPAPTAAYLEVTLREGTDDVVDVTILGADGTSAARVSGLRFGILDADHVTDADPSTLLHGLSWQPIPVTSPAAGDSPAIAVIGSPGVRATARLVRHLEKVGVTCTVAETTNELPDCDCDILFVPPTSGSPIASGRVYESAVQNATALARTVQALIHNKRTRSRMWVVTSGARSCTEDAALAERPLWGAVRTIAEEHPEIRCGVVDLADDDLGTLDLLAGVLRQPPDEEWLSLGVNGAEAARIVPRPDRARTPQERLDPDATYLITGGLGALGLEAAQHLHARGARNLVLASRRGLPDRALWHEQQEETVRQAISTIEDLERTGAVVHPLALDVTDAQACRTWLTPGALGLPAIRGVVHAAGVLRGCLIDDFDETTAHETMHAKVKGALVLHELFPPRALDFMVLFSSTAPLVTVPGGTAYAAANTFLDGLAAHRRLRGDNTLSIAWTAWQDKGMGRLSAGSVHSMRAQGFGGITTAEARQAWNCLHTIDDGYSVVVRPSVPPPAGRRSLFEHIVQPHTNRKPEQGATFTLLRQLPQEEVFDAAMAEVRRQVAQETGMPAERVEPNRLFTEIGIDSVMSIAIRGRLQQTTGVELPASIMWTHPTLAELARHLSETAVTGSVKLLVEMF